MDYIKSILDKLLDKADRIQTRRGSTMQRISLYVGKDKIFSEYWAEDFYRYRPDIHEPVDFLSRRGFVFADYDSHTELLRKVTLNTDNIAEAYAFLGRTPKQTTIANEIRDAKGYAYAKHGFCFKIHNQIVDLDALKADFAFSDEAIDNMEILSVSKRQVVTIENLTTFHYYNNSEAIIIYLGGYHNSIKRKLLHKLRSFDEGLLWLHMGDIDWGGFEIFMHLRNMTGINFVPFNMGIRELIAHEDECSPITENDRRKLELLLQNPDAKIFHDTIQFMLKHGYKLEQESLVFNT